MFIYVEITNFMTQFFLKILQRNSKLVILGTLVIPAYANSNHQLVENFCVYLHATNQLHTPHVFMEILQRETNFLFWVPTLSTPDCTHPK